MTLSILAPVKINLALHVGPARPDGYHPVDTLCVFPAFGDVLFYEPEGAFGLDHGGRFGGALAGEKAGGNLVTRAFGLLGLPLQGRFMLIKETPLASGMGAGTADGAAAMLLLNDCFGLGFEAEELIDLARGLGADGPVCMAGQIGLGGLYRAEGTGERVTALGRVEPMAVVLANPGRPVPTGSVFRRFDRDGPAKLNPCEIRARALPGLLEANANDLERPARELEPGIGGLLDVLGRQAGARAVRMSGSGATCYALHASRSSAERAARSLRARGFWAESSFILPG